MKGADKPDFSKLLKAEIETYRAPIRARLHDFHRSNDKNARLTFKKLVEEVRNTYEDRTVATFGYDALKNLPGRKATAEEEAEAYRRAHRYLRQFVNQWKDQQNQGAPGGKRIELADILLFARRSEPSFRALKMIVKEELNEVSAVHSNDLFLFVLDHLVSEESGPFRDGPGRKKLRTRDEELTWYIDLFFDVSPLDKGTGADSHGKPTTINAIAEALRETPETVKTVWKQRDR